MTHTENCSELDLFYTFFCHQFLIVKNSDFSNDCPSFTPSVLNFNLFLSSAYYLFSLVFQNQPLIFAYNFCSCILSHQSFLTFLQNSLNFSLFKTLVTIYFLYTLSVFPPRISKLHHKKASQLSRSKKTSKTRRK